MHDALNNTDFMGVTVCVAEGSLVFRTVFELSPYLTPTLHKTHLLCETMGLSG